MFSIAIDTDVFQYSLKWKENWLVFLIVLRVSKENFMQKLTKNKNLYYKPNKKQNVCSLIQNYNFPFQYVSQILIKWVSDDISE